MLPSAMDPITLRQFLSQTRVTLTSAGGPEPRLEAEVMLADVLDVPRHRLYAHQDEELSSQALETLEAIVGRRLKREPLAYVLGHREFYGIDLKVTPAVLVPRPETELLVERALLVCLERMDRGSLAVVDVGTGSGGIAINLALHLPWAQIVATDVSVEALEVALGNLRRHGVGERIALLQGDLLAPVRGPVDLIVANLPYLPTSRMATLQAEVGWEPAIALDGGPEGLGLLLKLLRQAKGVLAEDGVVLLEMDPGQGEPLMELAGELFPGRRATVEQDLAGLDRIFILDLSV